MSDEVQPKLKHGQQFVIGKDKFEVLTISTHLVGRHHYEIILASDADKLRKLNAASAKREAAFTKKRFELINEAEKLGITDTSLESFPTNEDLENFIDSQKPQKPKE